MSKELFVNSPMKSGDICPMCGGEVWFAGSECRECGVVFRVEPAKVDRPWGRTVWVLCVAAAIIGCIIGAAIAKGDAPTTRPTSPDVIVGVDKQPASSFDKWIARGINCFVGAEPNDKPDQTAAWEDELERRGVFFISYPSDDPARFAVQCKQRYRLAFSQNDEPDLARFAANKSNYPLPGWGWTDPQVLSDRYKRCKAGAPDVPVFVNFAGPNVTPTLDNWKYPPYIRAADWLAHDWYPANWNRTDGPAMVTLAMDRLRAWSKLPECGGIDRPQLAYIECSDQALGRGGRCPTPDEMEATVTAAIARGARGVVYFPQRPTGGASFRYDDVPPPLVERMTAVNARLVPPPVNVRIAALESALGAANAATARAQADATAAKADAAAARADAKAIADWLRAGPATKPTNP